MCASIARLVAVMIVALHALAVITYGVKGVRRRVMSQTNHAVDILNFMADYGENVIQRDLFLVGGNNCFNPCSR